MLHQLYLLADKWLSAEGALYRHNPEPSYIYLRFTHKDQVRIIFTSLTEDYLQGVKDMLKKGMINY